MLRWFNIFPGTQKPTSFKWMEDWRFPTISYFWWFRNPKQPVEGQVVYPTKKTRLYTTIPGGAKEFLPSTLCKELLNLDAANHIPYFNGWKFMRFQADHYVPSIGLDLIHKVAMNGHQPFPWQRMQRRSWPTKINGYPFSGDPGYKITSWGLSGVWSVWYEWCFGWCFGCLGLTCGLEIPII